MRRRLLVQATGEADRAARREARSRDRRDRCRRGSSCRSGYGASQSGDRRRALRRPNPATAAGSAQHRNVDPVPPLFQRLASRAGRRASRATARPWPAPVGAPVVGRDGKRLVGERQGAEAPAPPRAQRSRRAVKGKFVRLFDRARRDRLDIGRRQRRGEENARRGGAARHFADRKIRLAGERARGVERGGPPVGHEKFAALASRDGDALG